MRNKRISETEADLVRSAIKTLSERLPPNWKLEETSREALSGKASIDAVMRLRSPDGAKSEIVIETKKRMDPVDVSMLVVRVRQSARGRPVCLVAPFLSKRTRERLKEEGVGYVDTTGNAWVVLDRPGLFIETMGADRDPEPVARPLASLKGRVAGRVVRALCDYAPPYGIRELADRSNTPLASVARVVALLEREAIVFRQEQGRVAKCDPEALIRRWTQDYSLQRSNVVKPFLEPRSLKNLISKLRELKQRYAVTGSFAAATKVTVFPGPLIIIYVDDPTKAAEFLGLTQVDAGANVLLARPFDAVVYDRTSQVDNVTYAAPSQVASDLLTSPGRGPSDGEELLTWMRRQPNAWRT